LIYSILIFSVWAFGSTEDWAISTLNTLNYLLGTFLAAKMVVCKITGFQPETWNANKKGRGIVIGLFVGTVLALGYIALSAWNARAEFLLDALRFEYFENSKEWLPRSYNRSATWAAFQNYLAAACFFWGLRQWLITKSRADVKAERESKGADRFPAEAQFPARLKRLLWVLCINGAVLALQGTLQRLSGSNDLLWMVRPQFNEVARAQFGPFNYRSNGAQYLNMLWPVALAFWWALHKLRRGKLGQGSELILLLFSGLMIGGPIIANSRGGVAVAIAQTIGAIAIFGFAFRRRALWKTLIVSAVFLVVVGSTLAFQWQAIQTRLTENTFNTLSGRTEIYQNAKKIGAEFPLWGSGPGTFAAMYFLYRDHPDQLWFAQAHDDYLQTRVTFGPVGLFMALALVVLAASHPFGARGIPSSSHFIFLLWCAAGGCLAHAKFDFPFQIYSLLLLFLTICGILSAISKK
jgi:O-antigen ligase